MVHETVELQEIVEMVGETLEQLDKGEVVLIHYQILKLGDDKFDVVKV